MAATVVTLNDLGRYLSVAGLFRCNPSNICAAFYTISTDSMLARGSSASAELLVEHSCRESEVVVKCCMRNFSNLVYCKVISRCGHRGYGLRSYTPSICVYVYCVS